MSGGIRRTIAPTLARLQRYLAEIPDLDIGAWAPARGILDGESYENIKAMLTRISKTMEYLERYNDMWINLLATLPHEERIKEQQEYDRMAEEPTGLIQTLEKAREVAMQLEISLEERGAALGNISQRGTERHSELASQMEAANGHSGHTAHIGIPNISLPAFDGEITEWPAFWSRFERTIHGAPLNDADKLTYLQSLLRGKALQLVSGYAATANNYSIVLNILQQKYGSNEKLKWILRKQLREIPRVKRDAELLAVLNDIENILQRLESIHACLDEDSLQELVQEKLPFWLVKKIQEEKLSQTEWDFQKLRRLLRQEAIVREETQFIIGQYHTETNEESKKGRNMRSTERNERMTIMSISEKRLESRQREKIPKAPCAFCGGGHFNDMCPQYTTLNRRINRIRELKLCESCLRRGHAKETCKAKLRPCFYCKASSHISAICPLHYGSQSDNDPSSTTRPSFSSNNQRETNGQDQESNRNLASMSVQQVPRGKTILMCRQVQVRNPENPSIAERVIIFFDTGSQRSFIDENLAKRLDLATNCPSRISITTFNIKQPVQFETSELKISLRTTSGFQTIQLNTVKGMAETFPYFEIVSLEDDNIVGNELCHTFGKPEILIGMDNFFKFFLRSDRTQGGLYVVQTTLGPLIAGSRSVEELEVEHGNVYSILDPQNYWDLETIGIVDKDPEKEESEVHKQVKTAVERDDTGRYIVGWPWRNGDCKLSATFGICYGRLQSLVTKLRGNKQLLEEYDATFRNQLQQGIIELAPVKPDGVVHYLPHRMVLTPGKSTKLRVVFNASAKGKEGYSLNEVIHKGPSLLPDLVGILLRSRTYSHLLTADVEKAFLQIGLRKEDRDVTRFLWIRNIEKPVDVNNLVVYRYTRVNFGVSASPFLMSAIIKHHLEQHDEGLAKTILKDLYADNVIVELSSGDEAVDIYRRTKEIFKAAKMNLRNYCTNKTSVMQQVPEVDREVKEEVSLLGLRWNLRNDTLTIPLLKIPSPPLTKRRVDQFIRKHFDPLGLIAPVFIAWKAVVQDFWKKGCDWDETVPNERIDMKLWRTAYKQWNAGKISFPRVAAVMGRSSHLHVFVDASSIAYAAVVYLVAQEDEGIKSHLIFCKSRLLPIKQKLTIPRAELMAAWIGVKALTFVCKQLNKSLSDCFAWTDSRCVIEWINSKNIMKLPVFVRNRVKTIQEAKLSFNHVSSELNPADIASRGVSAAKLVNTDLWWYGPDWSKMRSAHKMKHGVIKEEIKNDGKNLTGSKREVTQMVITENNDDRGRVVPVIEFSITKSWRRMRKIATYVRKIVLRLTRPRILKEITEQVLRREAEEMLYQEAQKWVTVEEINRWDLRQDDRGLWRMAGRFELEAVGNRPIYLPRDHPIIIQLVLYAHEGCGHLGTAITLTEFRTKYWMEKGRSKVRQVLANECLKCKRDRAKRFELPEFAPLPLSRIEQANVFENVALDYAGPFQVETERKMIRKQWVCLFTCLAVRAIHLEVVPDLSTTEFVNAYNRFTARRGEPRTLFSDNGKQFVAAAKTLNVEWKFITPHAPWKGGVYERLIGLLKTVLKKTIRDRLLSQQEFSNVIIQAEKVLNARPITAVTSDPNQILRPADFIIPKVKNSNEGSSNVIEESGVIEFKEDQRALLKRMQKTEECLKNLWSIWKKEYLQFLRERSARSHQNKNATKREPRIGEVVLLEEGNKPRARWRLVRIVELFRDCRGKIKAASVRIPHARLGSAPKILKRPLSLLYSLEIPQNETLSSSFHRNTADNNLDAEAEEVYQVTEWSNGIKERKKTEQEHKRRSKKTAGTFNIWADISQPRRAI